LRRRRRLKADCRSLLRTESWRCRRPLFWPPREAWRSGLRKESGEARDAVQPYQGALAEPLPGRRRRTGAPAATLSEALWGSVEGFLRSLTGPLLFPGVAPGPAGRRHLPNAKVAFKGNPYAGADDSGAGDDDPGWGLLTLSHWPRRYDCVRPGNSRCSTKRGSVVVSNQPNSTFTGETVGKAAKGPTAMPRIAGGSLESAIRSGSGCWS
jgi:hypothetical protein